jgi:hypothetical protein
MAKQNAPTSMRAEDLLRAQKKKSIPLSLPPAIIKRLDDRLIGALETAGHGLIARHEIIGALLLDVDLDVERVYELVRGYRTATVGQALPGEEAEVIDISTRSAGRPKAS